MNEFWTNYLFPFLTIIGMIILYYTVKHLLPSYFNEKGKNLATKEDVSAITQLVEEVKLSFTKETEQLKANLLLLTNVQLGIASEERNSIIEYNEKYFRWLNLLLDSSMREFDTYNNKELDKYEKFIADHYNDFLNSETKYNLFVENSELVDFSNQMKIETLKLIVPHPFNCASGLRQNNLDIQTMENNTPIGDQSKLYSELLEKRKPIKDEFRKQILENYKIIAPLTNKFQKMCRNHIYQLIQNQSD